MADRNGTQPAKHDPRTCNCCAFLRHPATAAEGRALRAHLDANPLPRQNGGQR
jgi:hypothetical protein